MEKKIMKNIIIGKTKKINKRMNDIKIAGDTIYI